MGSPGNPLALLWKHRGLLLLTTRNDLRTRYAGALLGWTWVVAYPLIFLAVYSAYYIFVLGPRAGAAGAELSGPLKVGLVFSGLLPFLGFAEALSSGTGSVTGNAHLIKNTLYPIELIPVKAVLASQPTQLIGTALLLLGLGIAGRLTPWALLVPVAWLAQVALTMGIVWIFASVNVYLRDLQNMVGMLLLLIMLLSPIGLSAEALSGPARPLMMANPLYYVIVTYQDCLVFGRFPAHGVFWIMLLVGAAGFLAGHWFFGRLKRVFADNV
jgi:lipopolysaccharide transport system permease protein